MGYCCHCMKEVEGTNGLMLTPGTGMWRCDECLHLPLPEVGSTEWARAKTELFLREVKAYGFDAMAIIDYHDPISNQSYTYANWNCRYMVAMGMPQYLAGQVCSWECAKEGYLEDGGDNAD